MSDFIYAFRMIRRAPGLAAVAIVSLALGIGVNAVVFSVVNGVLLKPLPVADPSALVSVQTGRGTGQSYLNYVDLRDRNTTFESLAGYRIAPMSVDTAGTPRRVWGYIATGNYFRALGVRAAVGRLFTPDEDRHPGAEPYAVLSYDEWVSNFGASPAAIGSTIHINTVPFTVIGVAPKGFHGTEVFYRPGIWVPAMMEAAIEVGNPWLERRQSFNLWLIGRLKPGVTRAQADANLNAIAADLARTYPWPDKGMVMRLATPGLVGNTLRAPVEAFSIGVLVLAALVLVTACANLASLLLARGSDRRREMAIRLSIGAGRGRLLRQLLTESLVLSLVGGACGLALASLLARALSAWQLPVTVPIRFDVSVDWRVVFFAIAVSTIAGVLFGVAPARAASATDPNLALKGDAAIGVRRRWAFRDALVAAQVALCFMLVTACLVSFRGLHRALETPLGFEPHAVAIASFELGLAGYDQARGRAFQQRAVEEARAIPGVSSAAFSNSLPLSIDQSHNTVTAEHADPADAAGGNQLNAAVYEVSPGFLRTLGIRLLAGRDFDARDTAASPEVAIVNEAFARQVLKSVNPIGQRFRYGVSGPLIDVVGLVQDGKYGTLTESPLPVVFNAASQWYNSTTVLSVRSELPPDAAAAALKQTIARLDPSLPLYDVEGLDGMLGWALIPSRVAAIALGAFGLLALTLAATGLHGLVSYSVARRSREIAIRVAIGASGPNVLKPILTRTAVLVGVGAGAGALLASLATRLLSSVVFGVSPRDPAVIAAVAATMAGVGVVSCWAPARRALRVQPMAALKGE